ncbi:uncharacterized protein LOC127732368 [Mytilus californianus]|uniref:uncharacterized protein LOC127732368 n=1 Tax=Mytilus californianus TaxID=6549 RepID=UPI0022482A05|nr:uncharacterized protein LOC127732368 [Mytilus californianus]
MIRHWKLFPFTFYFTLLFQIINGTSPTGCSYDSAFSSTGIYTCVFGSYTEPLTYSGFSSPLPQRLMITNLNGNLPASGSAFSGFSSFTSGLFDKNYPAYLDLVCTTSGSITLTTSTFTDMSYLQEVKFSYCNIVSLSNGMLGPFGSLNSLIFEHGSIASYSADFLTSVTIEPLAVAEPTGELIIKDCSITPTTIPAGVFDGQTSIRTIKLDKAGVTAIDASAFSLTTQLNYISLVDNSITSLESNLFTSIKSLSSIDLGGLAYDCSCSNLDVLTYSNENSVKLPSDLICNTPASYQENKLLK